MNLSSDTQSRADKLALQIGYYLLLNKVGAQLDEAGVSIMQSIEEALLAEPPRVLLAAVASWNRAGQPWRDPRPVRARV
jgi:hypothetical protein